MEDAIIVIEKFRGQPKEHLFGVFDGHGGGRAARIAALHFASVFETRLGFHNNMELNIELALCSTFQTIEQMMANTADDSGTTACVAYFHNNTLWIANLGDSRAVLLPLVSSSL